MEKFFNKNINFLWSLLVILVLDYLVLLGMETILPGFVIDVFNMHLFLIGILVLGFSLSFASKHIDYSLGKWKKIFFCFLIVYLLIILAISLYKLSSLLILLYLFFSLLIGVLLYRNFFEKE